MYICMYVEDGFDVAPCRKIGKLVILIGGVFFFCSGNGIGEKLTILCMALKDAISIAITMTYVSMNTTIPETNP